MKPIRKSVWLPAALFVYVTAMAVYFLCSNGDEVGRTEKWLTILFSYIIVGLLAYVLRVKDRMRRRSDEQMNNLKNNIDL